MSKNFSFFKLNRFIANRNDWDTAYFLNTKILSRRTQFTSSFDDVGSKMLLTTSILLTSQTEYPDLLSTRTFLLLPKLKARLSFADDRGNVAKFGCDVTNGIKYIFDCPDERLNELISIASTDLALYLENFNLTSDAMIRRVKCLDLLFPMPKDAKQFDYILFSA